ncbi:MAG: biopolymer transporter ExbD [Pseudomonadota bacterium]
MKLSARGNEEPDVNLTSLIDVVLLLLIFFMVSTSFIQETELSIQLPEASLDEATPEPRSIEVAVSAAGGYFVNGKALVNDQPRTLRRALERELGEDLNDPSRIPLVVRADANATHQAVVTAMDVAARIGLTRVDIATVSSGGSPSPSP